MTFVQATTGSGGWPMSVWLTPSLQPFYGGTYFPPTSRWGRPGFVEILDGAGAGLARGPRAHRVSRPSTILERLRSYGQSAGGGRRARARRARPRGGRVRRRRSTAGAAASATRRSSRARRELLFLLREHARTGRRRAAGHGAARRCGRWRSAACATTSAAASTATPWTATGACRTSRRCSTTRRSWCSPTSRPRRRPATRPYADVAVDTLRLRAARPHASRRRVLLGRGRRQRAARARRATPHAHKMEGAFYIWTDARAAPGARRRCRGVLPALRREAGRQRARSTRRRSSPARTCCYTAQGARRHRRRTPGVDRGGRGGRARPQPRRAARRARPAVRGRTSTTRC